jgi:hypothetical protein
MTELIFSDTCLLFFVDDMGHETFADRQHPVLGLGGCAVIGRDYNRTLSEPWKKLKGMHFGGRDIPLHAARLKAPTQTQINALGEFFERQLFGRFATVIKDTSTISPGLAPYQVVATSTMKRFDHFLNICSSPPTQVAFIFEDSQRGNALAERYFGKLSVKDISSSIPARQAFMPKSANDPGLEVADFIIHAAGAQARNNRNGTKKIRRDFRAVFHKAPRHLVSYIEIDAAKLDGGGES